MSKMIFCTLDDTSGVLLLTREEFIEDGQKEGIRGKNIGSS